MARLPPASNDSQWNPTYDNLAGSMGARNPFPHHVHPSRCDRPVCNNAVIACLPTYLLTCPTNTPTSPIHTSASVSEASDSRSHSRVAGDLISTISKFQLLRGVTCFGHFRSGMYLYVPVSPPQKHLKFHDRSCTVEVGGSDCCRSPVCTCFKRCCINPVT